MRTQAAMAAPAMALAGMTPLPSAAGGTCAPEVMLFGSATTALLGLADGDWDSVPVAVEVVVPVAAEVAEARGDASEVGASLGPDPDPDAVGVPVGELDGTIYRVPVPVLLGYAVGLALFATTEGVGV